MIAEIPFYILLPIVVIGGVGFLAVAGIVIFAILRDTDKFD